MGMKPRSEPIVTIAAHYPHSDVPAIYERAAFVLLSNALVEARKSHRLIGGHCTHCGGKTQAKTACVICALLIYREVATDGSTELKAAKILGLPERWVLDMVGGFDGDHEKPEYRKARLMGRRLWKKYRP